MFSNLQLRDLIAGKLQSLKKSTVVERKRRKVLLLTFVV